MLQVDSSHFSNVITAVQRTASLPGGAVRGLPGGAVIEGLRGVNSFGSDVAEAKKEFQLGRSRTALERIKQIETQFSGIAGRWNANVTSLISSAKQGRQKLSLQKLNEVRNAQTKMRQLTGPASKAFQDLVTVLEHAVTMEGREAEEARKAEQADAEGSPDPAPPADTEKNANLAPTASSDPPAEATPDRNLLGSFAANYGWGERLQIVKGPDQKSRISPKLEKDKFYFLAGLEPPRVVRLREVQPKAIIVFDSHLSSESLIDSRELLGLVKKGIWVLA